MTDHTRRLEQSYDEYPRIEEAFQAALDESLDPRGPESLFEIVRSLGVPAGARAVDVGCGEGEDAIRLAQELGVEVVGIDPIARQVELATAAAAEAGLTGTVRFEVGVAEAIPLDDASVDLLWCKESLMFTDLAAASAEFARVLRAGGIGLAYQVCTGPRMSDAEAAIFWEGDLAYGDARSQRPADIEDALAAAGLEVRERVDFGGEWGEYAQEQRGAGGRRLVHAARLLRDPDRYISRFGEDNYRIMLGDCLWHVYRMIGRLEGVAFVFGRPQLPSG